MKTVSYAWLEMAESLTMDDIALRSRQGGNSIWLCLN